MKTFCYAMMTAAFTVVLAGCGSGGGGASVAPSPGPTGPVKTAAVHIAIVVPTQLIQALKRRPHYVSPATQTVQLSVNGGAPQTLPLSNGTQCSSQPVGGGQCTVLSVQAPLGTDTFAMTLLDGANVAVAQGSAQATIVADVTNNVNIVLNGVVASLTVGFSGTPSSGTPAKVRVSLFPLDADGYPIVGSPGALPAITVSDGDASGTTTLFIGTDATCATAAGAASTSVTATQTGTQYTLVCLSYNGGSLPSGATITASIAGGPSGSATLQLAPPPNARPNGVWALGIPQSGGLTLERFDVHLNPVTAMSGAATGLVTYAAGLAAEPSGSVDVLQFASGTATAVTYEIRVFPGNGSGNVPPQAITQFTLPPGPQGFESTIVGPALDGSGNAYVLGFSPPASPPPSSSYPVPCTIYRVPVNGSTAPATPLGSCPRGATYHPPTGIGGPTLQRLNAHTDAQHQLYISYDDTNNTSQFSSIYKYHTNANGSLTLVSAIAPVKDNSRVNGQGTLAFDFTPTGSLVVSGWNFTGEYSPNGFADGQTTAEPPLGQLPFNGGSSIAVDPSGNSYAGAGIALPGSALNAAAAPSSSVTATSNFQPYLLAAVKTSAGSQSSSLTAQPASIELPQGPRQVTVSEPGYTGPFYESDNCASKATSSPQSANGPSATFTLTGGPNGGTCQVTFTDQAQHTVQIAVGNTVTNLFVTGRRRQ